MKEIYNAYLERKEDGMFCVGDRKVDSREMTEVELVLYLGSLLGACIENMRQRKKVGFLHLKLMYCEENLLNN